MMLKHYFMRVSKRTFVIVREAGTTPVQRNLAMSLSNDTYTPGMRSDMFDVHQAVQLTKPLTYSQAMYCLALIHTGGQIPEDMQLVS